MKYINHVTLSSGNIRKSYPKEVDKSLYFELKRLYKGMLKEGGIEIFEGYVAKATKSNKGVLITVFNSSDTPILTTGISKNDDGELWEALHHNMAIPAVTNAQEPCDLPYIADRVEVGAMMSLDAMRWTGDFSRCMGWLILGPNKIR